MTPTFEEFARALIGDADPIPESTPLGELAVGHFAVLDWLDSLIDHYPARVEADLIAGWDTVSLRGAYDMIFSGVPSS